MAQVKAAVWQTERRGSGWNRQWCWWKLAWNKWRDRVVSWYSCLFLAISISIIEVKYFFSFLRLASPNVSSSVRHPCCFVEPSSFSLLTLFLTLEILFSASKVLFLGYHLSSSHFVSSTSQFPGCWSANTISHLSQRWGFCVCHARIIWLIILSSQNKWNHFRSPALHFPVEFTLSSLGFSTVKLSWQHSFLVLAIFSELYIWFLCVFSLLPLITGVPQIPLLILWIINHLDFSFYVISCEWISALYPKDTNSMSPFQDFSMTSLFLENFSFVCSNVQQTPSNSTCLNLNSSLPLPNLLFHYHLWNHNPPFSSLNIWVWSFTLFSFSSLLDYSKNPKVLLILPPRYFLNVFLPIHSHYFWFNSSLPYLMLEPL